LTRHGESEYNVKGRIGGDAELTDRGKEYALALADKMNAMSYDNLFVWTSMMRRTQQTAKHIKGTHER